MLNKLKQKKLKKINDNLQTLILSHHSPKVTLLQLTFFIAWNDSEYASHKFHQINLLLVYIEMKTHICYLVLIIAAYLTVFV